MGDSGYLILRKNKDQEYDILFKSKEQTHGFNFPYQLGTKGTGGDNPRMAVLKEHSIQEDDLIILCTDGLIDNLFSDWILNCVRDFFKREENIFNGDKIAESIGNLAYKVSLNTQLVTPFGEMAMKYNYKFLGGKSDDITVVVARIEKENN